jgi:hypothetical protein
LVVAETAFPWTNSAPVVGLPATPAGQVRYVIELARIVQGVPGGLGRGVLWWRTEYQRLTGVATAGFESRSFFDADGNVLPVAEAWGQLAAPLKIKAELTDTSVALSWSLSGAGAVLASATSLSPPATWEPLPGAAQSHGIPITALLPLNEHPACFFRLQPANPGF